MTLRQDYLQAEIIETIYFGGGTPSILTAEEIHQILKAVFQTFPVHAHPEITLEANPDDLSAARLQELKDTGVNRLSIGVQSFFDDDLQFLHRVHTAHMAERAIAQAQAAGFENLTIDLIYAIPTLTEKKWLANLQKIAEMHIPHFSAYCLTVEPNTALSKFIQEKKLPDVDEAAAAQHFEMLMAFAAEKEYEQYEISNFSKPGFQSKHNSAYWSGKKYLGLGPSAHSYNGSSRQWNKANTTLYIQAMESGSPFFEKEVLTVKDRFNEYVLTSLRTAQGADILFIEKTFGKVATTAFLKAALPWIHENMMQKVGTRVWLTPKGKLYADRIISQFFITEEPQQ
ncbi:MAG: coproporphyrinogen III oxidase [Chitinophagales bacterium]|nr:MAG: coproporphyrinogen III oxidase [Chitinophagales bacterium]